jgi:hypothetical protein
MGFVTMPCAIVYFLETTNSILVVKSPIHAVLSLNMYSSSHVA